MTSEYEKVEHQMVNTVEREVGSVAIYVRKRYNDKSAVSEYFEKVP